MKFIWNNSYLHCGFGWKGRKKKPEKISPDFFRLLLSNCINWKINCDDHSSLCWLSLLSSHISSYRLLICSRTSISYKTRIGERSFSSLTSNLLAGFSPKPNWAVFTDERICALKKRHVLLAIQGKLKLAKCYYFSVAIGPRTKSWQTCGKSRETLSLYIQIYPANFCFVMKKLLIFNIYII